MLKRSISYKEAHISLVPLTIPLAVGVKAYLIYFLFRREFEGFFCVNRKKISFSRSDFVES